MRVAIVLGTRPEIIKMSPVIRALQKERIPFLTLHTGQHYSYEMDRVFFEDLEIPAPDRNLEVGSGLHGAQTGKMLAGIEAILMDERPSVVLVEGDTNTVLAGALAAQKLGIPVGHVEAGLRSGDRTMPEEINRIVADHVSDHLFAPTEGSRTLLRREGLPDDRIHVTGNTIVDAVRQHLHIAERKSRIFERLGVSSGGFVLMTAHRQENVDHEERLRGLIEGARRVGSSLGVPVLYPIHPRSRRMLSELGVDASGLVLIEPLDYFDFLRLESSARLVLTDSGGVQEETCVLGVPCVTLRDNTERPETLLVGANALAGTRPDSILEVSARQVSAVRSWSQPFGSGQTGEMIVEILTRLS